MASGKWWEESWNPLVGCSACSPGCANCYAAAFAHRMGSHGNAKIRAKYQGLTKLEGGRPVWTGEVRFWPSAMQAPQHWKSPKRVFAGDMTDLFHPSVQDDWLESMFTVVRAARQHAFHILTKRPERLVEFAARSEACLSGLPGNVLFGVTVTSLDELWKLDVLLELSGAAGFFVSLEPLLGPVDLAPYFPRVICSACGGKGCPDCYRIAGLSWVVLGFETGDGARPYDPQWALDVRDACTRASVPFFFKSWGERKPVEAAGDGGPYRRRGDGSPILIRVGTHRSGRLLDGREHNDMPEVR